MITIHGAAIKAIEPGDCLHWLEWIQGGTRPDGHHMDIAWLLAHCDDGVAWGCYPAGATAWQLSGQVFPEISPSPTTMNLQQLRLFGPDEEILIWRTEDGFRGRVAADTGTESLPVWLVPAGETRILLGDRLLASKEGFSLVGDSTGSRHVVPIACAAEDFPDRPRRFPLRLSLRHYFEQDPHTGESLVALSRLVDVQKKSKETN